MENQSKTVKLSFLFYVLFIGFCLPCKAFALPSLAVYQDTLQVVIPDTINSNQDSLSSIAPEKTYNLPLKKEVDSVLDAKKFQKNFKPKYQSDPAFNYTDQTPSTWTKIKEEIKAFLVSLLYLEEVDYSTISWLIIALRILAVLFLLLLIFYIYKAAKQKDIYWLFRKSSKDFQVDLQKIQDNLESTDFEKLIAQSVQRQNYTIAIRLYYLWLLQHLEINNLVVWDKQKTNKDYQREIKNKKLQQEFTYACYLYENIWYGQHPIDKAQFDMAQHCFLTLLKTNDYA